VVSEYERMKADYDRMKRNEEARIERAAYERGLRRGMAIAREWEQPSDDDVAWRCAREQMEREIEEAKR
jgi:hypothetical protein